MAEAKRKLLERYSEAEIEEIIELYASAYGDSGLTAQEVLEEIICDAEGQMNAFATEETERVAGEVGLFLRNVRKAAKDTGATKNTTGEGGVKRSIELDALGRKYVQATRQVIEGNDPAKWGKQIENYINQEIRKGEDVLLPTDDGHILLLTERSAYKLSDRHKQDVRSKVRDLLSDYDFEVKSRMAAHIDELVQVGKFQKYREDLNGNHKNDIGEDGFNYYDTFFRDVDGKYYLVPISAGVNGKEETVYSIGNVEKRRYSTNTGSSSNGGAQKNGAVPSGDSIVYSVGKSQVQNSMKEAFERAQREKERKNQYSREMQSMEELRRVNRALERKLETVQRQAAREIQKAKDAHGITGTPTANKDDVAAVARRLLMEYGSKSKQWFIREELQKIADAIIGDPEADFSALRDKARLIADNILQGATYDINWEQNETFTALQKELRKTYITVTPSMKTAMGDWEGFRQRHRYDKAGMIIAVIAATFADIALSMALEQMPDIGFNWPGVVFPVAMVWYILTELGSILENAEKLGAPVPSGLVKMLAVSLTAVEKAKEPTDEKRQETESDSVT